MRTVYTEQYSVGQSNNQITQTPQRKRKKLGGLVVFIVVCFLPMIALGFYIDGKYLFPSTVATESKNGFTVQLQALSDPVWPFGPQDCRVSLKIGTLKICQRDFTLFDDGGRISRSNWKVDWEKDRAVVTISASEQADEQITLYYNGKT